MEKSKTGKNRLIVIVIAIVIAVTGGAVVLGSLFGRHAGIGNEALITYRSGYGGDMNGSSHETYVNVYDDTHAIITVSDKDWHYEDPTVTEYLTDIAVLDEIREVFLKYNMQRWDNKKFTDMFIADGATRSYSFWFEHDSILFSSQYFPEKYADKLAEITEIVRKYIAAGEWLPGLILPEMPEDEELAENNPDDGSITVRVFEYSKGNLHYRILNGTGEDTEIPAVYSLYAEGSNEPTVSGGSDSTLRTVYSQSSRDEIIKIPERLRAGRYRLDAGGLSCEFEIG